MLRDNNKIFDNYGVVKIVYLTIEKLSTLSLGDVRRALSGGFVTDKGHKTDNCNHILS